MVGVKPQTERMFKWSEEMHSHPETPQKKLRINNEWVNLPLIYVVGSTSLCFSCCLFYVYYYGILYVFLYTQNICIWSKIYTFSKFLLITFPFWQAISLHNAGEMCLPPGLCLWVIWETFRWKGGRRGGLPAVDRIPHQLKANDFNTLELHAPTALWFCGKKAGFSHEV